MATETTVTGRDSDKFMLRLPEGMRHSVRAAAERNARTMNAEIIHRLSSTFDNNAPALPPSVQEAVTDEQEARGGTPEEALTRLVLAGQSKGGTVFVLHLHPGTKLQDVTALLEAAKHVIPPEASVFLDRR